MKIETITISSGTWETVQVGWINLLKTLKNLEKIERK